MPSSRDKTFIVPRCTGKAFRVDRGQRFRVVECEGKQVASLMFFNAANYKEQFMAEFSPDLIVIYATPDGVARSTVAELLPEMFTPDHLD